MDSHLQPRQKLHRCLCRHASHSLEIICRDNAVLLRSRTDLCTAVAAEYGSGRLFAIPVNDPESSYQYPEQVRLELAQEDCASYDRAAEFLNFNGNDLVCLQHEYGIFGGVAGSHILLLLRKLRMPLVTTLHTVLREPNSPACCARRDRHPFGSFDRDERTRRISVTRCV